VLTGGTGKLAPAINKHLDGSLIAPILLPGKPHFDIVQRYTMNSILDTLSPSIIVHCAAMTHPMISHEDSPEESIKANIIGTANVAEWCIRNNAKMYYISTDWVYYSVNKIPEQVYPERAYGWSKLGGECSVNMVKRHTILRSAFCHEPFPHPKAFVDVIKSYMTCNEAAQVIAAMLNAEAADPEDLSLDGTFNLGGPTRTVHAFTTAKFSNQNIGPIHASSVGEYIPRDTSMDCSALRKVLEKIAPDLASLVGNSDESV